MSSLRLRTLRVNSNALKDSWQKVANMSNPACVPYVRRCVPLLRRQVGVDTPAGEHAAFGDIFAEFSPGHSRSKIVQDKARYRFDRQAPTKPRNAGLFRLCGMLSVSRNCRISAIYMPPNAAVPTILPLFMRRGYQYGRKQEELRLMALP